MLDVLGRELHMGDLVIANYTKSNDMPFGKQCFSMVIAEDRAFNGNDFKLYNRDMYLIANPCTEELVILEELKAKYVEYTKIKIKTAEINKIKQKENREKLKGYKSSVVGDVYETYSGSKERILYLGFCKMEVESNSGVIVKEGHLYIPLYFDSRKSSNVNTLYDKEVDIGRLLKLDIPSYSSLKVGCDAKIGLYNNVSITKSKSAKYTPEKLLGHVNISNWEIGNAIRVESYHRERSWHGGDRILTITRLA